MLHKQIRLLTAACSLLLLFALPHGVAAQSFGGSVASSGGDAFVGYTAATGNSGVVKVYRQSGGMWAEVAQLSAADATGDDDRFGRALTAHGDLLLAGATTRDNSRGGVYVFERQNGDWVQTALLMPEGNNEGDSFGRSVATDGSVVLAGAAGKDELTGAAYLFGRDASGKWMQTGTLAPEGLQPNDLFGLTVALDGHMALVTAIKQGTAPGDVYAYHHDADADAWVLLGKFPTPDVSPQSAFGIALGLTGNHALVGAPGESEVHTYMYNADTKGWEHTGMLSQDDAPGFGNAITVDGGVAYVGAPGAADGAGAIFPYRFDESSSKWIAGDRIEATGKMANLGGAIHVDGSLGLFGMPGADFGLGRVALMHYDADGLGWTVKDQFYDEVERLASVVGEEVSCESGDAAGFNCDKVDLLSFMSVPDIGGDRGIRVNDVWGWTDAESGKEYALVGRMDGTSFVDISDPYNPIYLGNLPKTEGSQTNTWRDIKVYADHAFIVADGAGDHGMQVFDLRQLRGMTASDAPVTFDETAHYDQIASAHNIVINEDTGFAYTVGNSSGGETCGGGSHMIDVRDPANPTFAGCFAHSSTGRAGTGYTHDAQCVIYNGPDTDYTGREICFGANETALSIADVTDKENTVEIAVGTYPNVGYAHQGWLTEDHRYILLNDELDELQGLTDGTRTLIWDLTDLDDPQLIKEYISDTKSSDHNLYVKDNYVYQSNYVSGLRILDISDINNPVEVAHFDTVPGETNDPGFDGSWSNYPFFKSGVIVVTSGNEGMFLVRKNEIGL